MLAGFAALAESDLDAPAWEGGGGRAGLVIRVWQVEPCCIFAVIYGAGTTLSASVGMFVGTSTTQGFTVCR